MISLYMTSQDPDVLPTLWKLGTVFIVGGVYLVVSKKGGLALEDAGPPEYWRRKFEDPSAFDAAVYAAKHAKVE